MVPDIKNRVGIGHVHGDMNEVYASRAILTEVINRSMAGYFDAPPAPEGYFRRIVKAGDRVLIKPNWVLERNWSGCGEVCLFTQHELIAAVVALVAACRPSRIVIGDSPIQNCNFGILVNDRVRAMLTEAAGDIPLEIVDFRRTVTANNDFARGVTTDLRPMDRYALFDLGRDSILEPLNAAKGDYRITNYDPRKLAEKHGPGRHQYLIAKEVFEADVMINMPKLKSHKKAGMTGALKNLVGINGNKDFLPHHRVGGSGWGGDCYPGRAPLKRAAEWAADHANMHLGTRRYSMWAGVRDGFTGLHRRWSRYGDADMEGSWYGNDTVWRMTLDLNRILLYGDADGTLADAPRRTVYTLTDALMAGDGEGPLSPKPLALGSVTFTSDAVLSDYAHCFLMRFDWKKVATVREAFNRFRYPLTTIKPDDVLFVVNGRTCSSEQLACEYGRSFVASIGWQDHVEDFSLRERANESV